MVLGVCPGVGVAVAGAVAAAVLVVDDAVSVAAAIVFLLFFCLLSFSVCMCLDIANVSTAAIVDGTSSLKLTSSPAVSADFANPAVALMLTPASTPSRVQTHRCFMKT